MDIKKVFKAKGITAKEVADKMGITPTGLSQHINGNPSLQVLERIAEAVGCKVGDFFERSELFAPSTEGVIVCPHCHKKITIKVEE